MKVRVSKDLKHWNGNYECEQSWQLNSMTLHLERGADKLTITLCTDTARVFEAGQAIEVVTTKGETVKIKGY